MTVTQSAVRSAGQWLRRLGSSSSRAMADPTYKGSTAGTPDATEVPTPAAVLRNGPAAVARWNEGRLVVAQSGCEACHTIGNNGNAGPGPNLTHIGSRLP